MSDVIVVMKDGLIQQQGGPTELYERPVNRFVADFIGTSNFIDATVAEFDAATRDGHRPDDRRARPARPTHRRDRIGRRRRCGHRGDPSGATGGRAGRASTAPAGTIQVSGRIHQGTYLGDQTEYRVQHRAGGRADRPPPERDGGGRRPGGRSGRSGGRPVARGGQPRPRGMSGQRRAGRAGTEEERRWQSEISSEMLARMAENKVNRRELPGGQRPVGDERVPGCLQRRRLGQRRAVERRASAAPSTGGAAGASRRAGRRRREGAVRLQLERLHLARPTSTRSRRSSGSTNFVYDIFANNEELIAKLQGGASGLRHLLPDRGVRPGHGRGGLPPEARQVPDPEPASTSTRRSRACGGTRTTSTRSPRTTARPASCTARPLISKVPAAGAEFYDLVKGEALGQDGLRRLDGRRLRLPAQDARATRSTRTIEAELEEARQILLEVAPHILALDSDNYGDKMATGEASLTLGWTGPLGQELADLRGRRRRRLRRPVRGHAVLDGRLGHARRRAASERRVRLAGLHPRARRSRPRRRTTTCTRRRTTRPRSSSIRRSWPTRRSSRRTTSSPTSKAPQDTSGNNQRIDIWEEFKSADRRLTAASSHRRTIAAMTAERTARRHGAGPHGPVPQRRC